MARFQVRGPHGDHLSHARWTVVDTADRDVAVDTAYIKRDAVQSAREMNRELRPLTVADVWPDRDADGLRAEVRRQWPQLADALDRECGLE